jgi:hypothetical protein
MKNGQEHTFAALSRGAALGVQVVEAVVVVWLFAALFRRLPKRRWGLVDAAASRGSEQQKKTVLTKLTFPPPQKTRSRTHTWLTFGGFPAHVLIVECVVGPLDPRRGLGLWLQPQNNLSVQLPPHTNTQTKASSSGKPPSACTQHSCLPMRPGAVQGRRSA